MNAFTYRMPAGIPGAVSRAQHATIEPVAFDPDAPFSVYGAFGKTDGNAFVPLESGDAAADITGLLIRPYPTNSSQDGMGTSTPPESGVGDRMVRGYATVLLTAGTAAKDGQVYVRVTASGDEEIGTIEAAADGGDCVAVSRCFFTGPADANGNVEIAFNI